MKKATILIFSLLLGVFLMTGCSSDGKDKSSYTSDDNPKGIYEESGEERNDEYQEERYPIPIEDNNEDPKIEPGDEVPEPEEEVEEEDPLTYLMGEWDNEKNVLGLFELAALYITRLDDEWIARVWRQQEGSMYGHVEEEVVKVSPTENSLTIWTKSPLGVERKLGVFKGSSEDQLNITERISSEGKVTANNEHSFENVSRLTDLCTIDFQTFGDATGMSDLISVCLTDGKKIWAQSKLFNDDVIHVEGLPAGKTFKLEEMFMTIRMMEKRMPPSFGGGPIPKLEIPVVPSTPALVQSRPATYKLANNKTWIRPAISKDMLSKISRKKTTFTKELKSNNLKIWRQLEKNDLEHFQIEKIKEGQMLKELQERKIETGNVKHLREGVINNQKTPTNIRPSSRDQIKAIEGNKVKRIDGSKVEKPKNNRYRKLDKRTLEKVKEKEGGQPSSFLYSSAKAEFVSFKNGINAGHLIIIPSKESFSCSDGIVELEMTFSED